MRKGSSIRKRLNHIEKEIIQNAILLAITREGADLGEPLPSSPERDALIEKMTDIVVERLIADNVNGEYLTEEELRDTGIVKQISALLTHMYERRQKSWMIAKDLARSFAAAAMSADEIELDQEPERADIACGKAISLGVKARATLEEVLPYAQDEVQRIIVTINGESERLRAIRAEAVSRIRERGRQERIATHLNARNVIQVQSPRCSHCGKKPRKIDDYCKKCARELGIIVHGKIT